MIKPSQVEHINFISMHVVIRKGPEPFHVEMVEISPEEKEVILDAWLDWKHKNRPL